MLAKEFIVKESLVERRRGGKVRGDHPSPVLQKGSPEEEGTCPKVIHPVKTGLGVAPEPGVDGGREFSGSRAWGLSQKFVLDTGMMAVGISPHSLAKEKWREAPRF